MKDPILSFATPMQWQRDEGGVREGRVSLEGCPRAAGRPAHSAEQPASLQGASLQRLSSCNV